jgi:hypothetical protein
MAGAKSCLLHTPRALPVRSLVACRWSRYKLGFINASDAPSIIPRFFLDPLLEVVRLELGVDTSPTSCFRGFPCALGHFLMHAGCLQTSWSVALALFGLPRCLADVVGRLAKLLATATCSRGTCARPDPAADQWKWNDSNLFKETSASGLWHKLCDGHLGTSPIRLGIFREGNLTATAQGILRLPFQCPPCLLVRSIYIHPWAAAMRSGTYPTRCTYTAIAWPMALLYCRLSTTPRNNTAVGHS